MRDITEAKGLNYYTAAVGEVNVTTKMREVGAVIGGEGNGGVIFPELHYGRDAYMGIALFLSNMARKRMKATELRATYPPYYISKNRIELSDKNLIDKIFTFVKKKYSNDTFSFLFHNLQDNFFLPDFVLNEAHINDQ